MQSVLNSLIAQTHTASVDYINIFWQAFEDCHIAPDCPRAILFTTPLRQTRKDSGNPDPTLGCQNGVVFKIDLGPFVTDEGRQKRARLKIRIQIGRERSGLPQRPDSGQNVRIWQPQRLTKVCIVENNNDLIK